MADEGGQTTPSAESPTPIRMPRWSAGSELRGRPRPEFTQAIDRDEWRLAALALALNACRGRSANYEQLHVLIAALREPDIANKMLRAWQDANSEAFRAYTHGLGRVVALSAASGLVVVQGERIRLTDLGRDLVASITALGEEAMANERQFLDQLRPISSSGMWERLGQVKSRSSLRKA